MRYKSFLLFLLLLPASILFAQTSVTGKIYDAVSKEAVGGVTVSDNTHSVMSDASGKFSIRTKDTALKISCTGYATTIIKLAEMRADIALQPVTNKLGEVVVSANRTVEKRTEAPIAISVIGKQTIEDTKAQRLDFLLNKVSGVNMVNLGNEQHEMSIRQPMTTNNLFLYLEDGIPLRTSAVFNHNALIEMNMTAAKSIEVIKGPSSALYGAEAIAGTVNLITQAPPAFASGYVSAQMNNHGYKRADAQVGFTQGKIGFIASGYYANQNNGIIQYSDFHKSASTYRLDYHIDSNTTWTNSVTYVDYFSDMYGSLDSAHFAQKNYAAQKFFTYRKVYAFRGRSTISHKWNDHSTTTATFMYRNNSVIQNPAYQIASYHVGGVTANPVSNDTATGNINDNAFHSYGLFLQHVQQFKFLKSKLIVGSVAEVSPQQFNENFIWVKKENGNYVSYTNPDSLLANFKTLVTNAAAYADYDFTVARGLRISTALRYDAFEYSFVNFLTGSKVTGGPSSVTNYHKLAPKVGFTYNINGIGFYGNFSQGYVPPQITDVFGKVNSTYLKPQNFTNYEIGGWLSLIQNKIYIDWSAYLMNGKDEIISVRMPDGTSQSQNAGQTRHKGLEYGITYTPTSDWMLRFSGTSAKHSFVNYVASGVDYNGEQMSTAPNFFGNAEVEYKPHYVKGFRIGAEWQHVGKYFEDNLNTHTYNGYNVLNLRVGYSRKHYEVWINALNVLNEYYSVISTYSASSGYNYQLGDPRAFTFGVSYKFGK
ncbi:TonB-dependent receptor [Arachidicoccus ginsenosidimutans]|uniref:TonB-dependent receptor n=1 Tax=Arachidicoccus sp. BS20 TaxID=1850526 RepID=UPI0007F17BCB|nr:TonB-dependent receptor [Arachidicoccus sp. BS20]ANI88565.1 TonB-dependent receptor [Arachidicoccus sp. BS20]